MSDNPFLKDWPTADRFEANAAYLHAFGAITLTYNNLEALMGGLFSILTPLSMETTTAIYARLTNIERIDILRELISERSRDDATKDAMMHAVLCFNIATDNRNVLMHLVHRGIDEETSDLLGRKRSSTHRDAFYRISLVSIRKLADDLRQTTIFAGQVVRLAIQREFEFAGHQPPPDFELTTLPEKPPQPDRLIPLPPLTDAQGG